MSYQNRTTEFFSLCQSLPSGTQSSNSSSSTTPAPPPTGRYNQTSTNPTKPNPTDELISFHQTASHLSQKIYTTSTLLNQLTNLIQSRSGSLFVDDSSQVNTLVLRIKSNIETLNSELDGANELIERNRRRTGRQAGLEANNLVGQLRDEFISTTKGFKDILKVRSERMKERNDRQSEVMGFDNGSVGVAGGGEEEMEEASLLGNRPRIYEDKMTGGDNDGGFGSGMGGGSALVGNKMDGPRLDLTSAILGQQQVKQQQAANNNVMPGGESSMQLPRPYGGIRQRNTNSSNPSLPTYSGSSSSIYYNSSNPNPNIHDNSPSSSHLPVYSPLDLQRMEANSSQRQQLQLIPDQTYLRQRADAMSEVETNIVELGTIFNKLAVMVNEHEELVMRVEDNVDQASENIGLSMEVLTGTMENLRTNRALFLKVFTVLIVFVIMFICFFA